MEGSWKVYRSDLRCIYKKINDILKAPITDSQISTLTSALKQLNQKKTQISQLDSLIAEAIETTKDLETEILVAEGVQDELSDRITQLRHFLDQVTSLYAPTRCSRHGIAMYLHHLSLKFHLVQQQLGESL